jgi:hypothetical protein
VSVFTAKGKSHGLRSGKCGRLKISIFSFPYDSEEGTAVARWLRYCATYRKVTGLIPDGVIGVFH